MNRRESLTLLAAVPLLGSTSRTESALPVELRGGRFFAVPRMHDGRTFACWLDTDGSGFVFERAVGAFGLTTRGEGSSKVAALPLLYPALPSVPGNVLAVFDESPADRLNPILAGFDAQLGGSWFAGRIWRFDFPGESVAVNAPPLSATDSAATFYLAHGRYPHVETEVAGERILMSLDIAASVAYHDTARGGAQVAASSFVTRHTFDSWRRAHPLWRVDFDVSTRGIDEILVPEVRLGAAKLTNVAFTTRPGDDVFQGDDVRGKLGANAYQSRVVILDYRNRRLKL